MAVTISKEDKVWRAQEDARTLMRATEIQNDKSRKGLALKEVKNIASEALKTAKTASKLSGRSTPKKTTPRKVTNTKKR